MGYINDSLGANETVHYVGHFHWLNYAFAYGVLIISIILGIFSYTPDYPILVLGAPAVGLVIFLGMLIPIWTTEIGVTNQRVILKRGFIQRETQELQLRAVEEVSLDQGILGRIFGYGKINVHGTGEEEILFPTIGDPLELRRALQEAIGQVQNATRPVLEETPLQTRAVPT